MEPRIDTARVTSDKLHVVYRDGRELTIPLAFYWRLADATPSQLQNFEVSASGRGIHWPDLDEDLSARGLLDGTPAPRPEESRHLAMQSVADRLGIQIRTLQKSLKSMAEAGLQVGGIDASGRRRLSEAEVDAIRRWRGAHPRGRPRGEPVP